VMMDVDNGDSGVAGALNAESDAVGTVGVV